MKKVKILAFAMVIAVMMMGMAYAAWTDQLVLQTTVQTGIMDVNYIQGDGLPYIEADDYVNASVSFDPADEGNDTLNVSISNLYPGATATLSLGIVNDSTIPVIGKLFVNGAEGNTLDLTKLFVSYNGQSLGSVQDVIDAYKDGVDVAEFDVGQSEFVTLVFTLDPELTGDEQENCSAAFTVKLDCRQYNDNPLV